MPSSFVPTSIIPKSSPHPDFCCGESSEYNATSNVYHCNICQTRFHIHCPHCNQVLEPSQIGYANYIDYEGWVDYNQCFLCKTNWRRGITPFIQQRL